MTFYNYSLLPAPLDIVDYQETPIEAGLLDLPLEILPYTQKEISDIETITIDFITEEK